MAGPKKRILVVSNYYFPEMGAAPQRITSLAESLDEFGYNVAVLCPLPNYPDGKVFPGYRGRLSIEELVNGLEVRRLFIYPSKSNNPLLRAISMVSFAFSMLIYLPLKRPKVDLILIQSPPLIVSFSAVFISKHILRKKVCLNVSDLWPQSAVELGVLKRGRMHALLLRLEKYIYQNSDQILGQSEEILEHIKNYTKAPTFLYRNLPKETPDISNEIAKPFKNRVVYAGLLGFAQGIFKLCKEVDFKSLGLEFHIYGKGMEEDQVRTYCEDNPSSQVFFHGAFESKQAPEILIAYDIALVPLASRIQGAVPSKIYELIQCEVPILFAGGGEGAQIVEEYGIGLTATPGNHSDITAKLSRFTKMSEEEWYSLRKNIQSAKKGNFEFENQFKKLVEFIS